MSGHEWLGSVLSGSMCAMTNAQEQAPELAYCPALLEGGARMAAEWQQQQQDCARIATKPIICMRITRI